MKSRNVVLIVLLLVGGLGVLAIASCAGLAYWGYTKADKEASPCIDALFSAIADGKTADTYESLMTPEYRGVTSKQEHLNLGNLISNRLGRLQSKVLTGFNMRTLNGQSTAEVAYLGEFEKGPGTITANLKKDSGNWRFLGFHVESPVFLADLATVACPECGAQHPADAKFCPGCGAKLDGEAKKEKRGETKE